MHLLFYLAERLWNWLRGKPNTTLREDFCVRDDEPHDVSGWGTP